MIFSFVVCLFFGFSFSESLDYKYLRKIALDNDSDDDDVFMEEDFEIRKAQGEQGVGLFAARNIRRGEKLFSIPMIRGLNRPLLEKHYDFGSYDKKPFFEEAVLSHYIASLWFNSTKEEKKKNPFLYTLGRKCRNGHTFIKEVRKVFDDVSFYKYEENKLKQDIRMYAKIKKKLEKQGKTIGITYKQFLWGRCVVRSRGFCPTKHNAHFGYNNVVPVVDVINHSFFGENVDYEPINGTWVFTARRNIRNKDQVFLPS